MANTYLIDLDLAQLREHRSRVENRPLTDDDVRSWLLDLGVCPRMDGLYLADDGVLRLLDPS
ncbi:MAG TPA: hypothetical protein VGP99_07010, partial [Tepidisphaeraceae bacterium]|nr:hypothetical protein [Tepidisphaeraceae bacterium]